MKKSVACMVLAALAGSLAYAGGSSEKQTAAVASARKVVTTEVRASYASEEWFNTMNADFEAETGIHVEVTATPGNDDDHDAKVNIDLMAGNPIDVIESVGPKNYTIRNEGKFFMPLKDLVARAGVDANALWGSNLPADQSGEYYGIPFKQELWCVYYNKDMFDAAGVEYPKVGWTWDEYVAIAKKLSDPKKGIYGSFMQPDSQWMFLLARQKDVPFYKADGTSNFDDPAFAESIKWYKELSSVQGIQMGVADLQAENVSWNYYALAGDHLGMFCQGNWFTRLLNSQNDYPRDWKYGIAPLPANADGKRNLTSIAYASVNKNAAHPDEAVTYVLWLAQNQWKYEGGIPALATLTAEQQEEAFSSTAVASNGQIAVSDLYDALIANGLEGTPSDIVGTAATEYNTIVQEEVRAYCMDLQSLSETIGNIVSRANEAIANAR